MIRPTTPLRQGEFVALLAMIVATTAFSIDAMLPALPQIAAELTPDAPNRAQLIITSFVLGMGLGTLVAGPLSDRFGRKAVVAGGAVFYIAAALAAWVAPTLETVLVSRVVMGLGAAGPRVAAMALVRDLHSGRNMARIMSFIMIVFSLVPALAPSMGAAIMAFTGWRGIFPAFVLFSLVSVLWLTLRQPETLPPERRRPLSIRALSGAVAEMFAHPTARLSILVQTLAFGMLFSVLSSTQQIFDVAFGRGDSFPLWFGGIAIVAASAGFVNARLVVRLGMRLMIKAAFAGQIVLSVLMVAVMLAGVPQVVEFPVYVLWTTSVFFQTGLSVGNLNALAMEPMGHIAGLAASVITAVSTVGAVLIAVPIGLAFDGTPLPNAVGVLVCAALALWLTTRIRRDSD